MDLICCDDYFTPEAREVYEKYGVVTPYLDGIYSCRELVISRIGRGFLLNEIRNPKIPVGEGESGFMVEPNFNVNRFRNIDGTEINENQIQELLIKQKTHLEPV